MPMQRPFQRVKSAARSGYVALAWAVVAFVVIQVFYAGVAVLIRPGHWLPHTRFGHLFGPLVFGLFVCAVIGRMPRRFVVHSLSFFVLYALQYVFIYVAVADWFFLRALHPVNALVMMVLALHVARGSSQFLNIDSLGRKLLTGAVAVLVVAGFVAMIGLGAAN